MKKTLAVIAVLLCFSSVFAESDTLNISAYNTAPIPDLFYQVLFQFENYVSIFSTFSSTNYHTETSDGIQDKTFDLTGSLIPSSLESGNLALNTMAFKVVIRTNMATGISIALQISPFTAVKDGVTYRIPTKYYVLNSKFNKGERTVSINGVDYKYTSTPSLSDVENSDSGSITSVSLSASDSSKTVYIKNKVTAKVGSNSNPNIADYTEDDGKTLKGIGNNLLDSNFKMSVQINDYNLDNVQKNVDYISTIRVTISGT